MAPLPRRSSKLKENVTIIDGAMGSMLPKYGVIPSDVWEGAALACIAPEAVTAAHVDYIQAGADMIITTTYANNKHVMSAAARDPSQDPDATVCRANTAAVQCAQVAVSQCAPLASGTLIAGSMSNCPPDMVTVARSMRRRSLEAKPQDRPHSGGPGCACLLCEPCDYIPLDSSGGMDDSGVDPTDDDEYAQWCAVKPSFGSNEKGAENVDENGDDNGDGNGDVDGDAAAAVAGGCACSAAWAARERESPQHKAWMEAAAWPPPVQEYNNYKQQATALREAGVDVLMLEMVRNFAHGDLLVRGASDAGVDVFVGLTLTTTLNDTGEEVLHLRDDDPQWTLQRVVKRWSSLPNVVGFGIMHVPLMHTEKYVRALAGHWGGPIYAYPNVGHFQAPDWIDDPSVTPEVFAQEAAKWIDAGATMVGGCCGTTPEHIHALSSMVQARYSPSCTPAASGMMSVENESEEEEEGVTPGQFDEDENTSKANQAAEETCKGCIRDEVLKGSLSSQEFQEAECV